ncbi:siderophore-interacting protein [Paractinoplanes abujensis]|uniref:NADPH-dependent ferric siderophore reductase n=1 Tax=Paractinoplanes abujensis TaxID=882441 RepID=A0A7W7CPB2_9ACTN|nr:siderophore-interacting protein [Actinoplanes abujensis]MBB4692250.1 NADPH-dependent ferric siderophore reductase [Actinoplanes abujensis]GID24270.1 siderophore-interacting protein [Actinoplanes abujensis]
MIPKGQRPASRTMITLEVRRREFLTPGFASVTLGGPAVRDLHVAGNDQAVRLFFPREGQAGLRMPTISNEAWMAQVLLLPKSVRPWVRNLTVRRVRPAHDEIDIEFAVHGDSPMSSWVRRAEPGSHAGIFDIGTMYRRPDDVHSQLLVGDETALPAILAILDGTPPGVTTSAYVEVATTADIRPDPRIRWFARTGQRPDNLLLNALRNAELPAGRFYTWTAGESRLAASVRRHLVKDRTVPKRDISFFGYWRLGRSSPG